MEELEYVHLTPESLLPALTGAQFKVVIAIDDNTTLEWRREVCKWLVQNGCRYAVTWGVDCEAWHDEVDHANRFDDEHIPEDDQVMTTWHEGKPLEDAFWFAGQCAEHPSLELKKTYILHIAAAAKEMEYLQRYRAAQEDED